MPSMEDLAECIDWAQEKLLEAQREIATLKQHLIAHGCDDPEATDHA